MAGEGMGPIQFTCVKLKFVIVITCFLKVKLIIKDSCFNVNEFLEFTCNGCEKLEKLSNFAIPAPATAMRGEIMIHLISLAT